MLPPIGNDRDYPVLKLSVLVPAYKLDQFIGPCLQSLLDQQTDFPFEVVVADDGSPDNTLAVITSLAARYGALRSEPNATNLGLAKTQKALLAKARGQYIAYVDGDDLALPGKLQALVDHLDNHPGCSLVYHEAEVFDSDSNQLLGHYSRDYYNNRYIPAEAGIEHLIRYGNFINASSIAFRRHPRLAEAVDEGCKIILDYPWHILNLALNPGSADRIDQVLGRYRMHPQSFGGQTRQNPERREQSLADMVRACDNAAPFGVAPEVIAAGKAQHYFAAALYFLRAGDIARFQRLIALSAKDGQFFDDRHRLAADQAADPEAVKAAIFGAKR